MSALTLSSRSAELVDDEEPDRPVPCVLVDDPAVRIESIGSYLYGQTRAVQAVDTPAIPAKHLPDHDLVGDALILSEERPTAL
jgi:hypothetical protein